jgi:hypothetical protein
MGQLLSSVSVLGLHSFRFMNFAGALSRTPATPELLPQSSVQSVVYLLSPFFGQQPQVFVLDFPDPRSRRKMPGDQSDSTLDLRG